MLDVEQHHLEVRSNHLEYQPKHLEHATAHESAVVSLTNYIPFVSARQNKEPGLTVSNHVDAR